MTTQLFTRLTILFLLLASARGFTANPNDTQVSAEKPSHSAKHKIWVNCDKGRSLARALKKRARPGTTIRLRGICKERITIKTDWITIESDGTATIDGSSVPPADPEFNALITIDGATGVTLSGLVVENSAAEGIYATNNASVRLRDMTIRNNANVGLLVEHAKVDLENSTSMGNLSGMDSLNNATIVFRGQIDFTQNFVFGVGASNGTALELRGAQLNISQNGLAGAIIESAHMAIFNFTVSQGSSILADNNGQCGLIIVGGGFLDIIAPPPFQNTGVNLVSASNNGDCGIWLPDAGLIESPFGAATFQIENNQVGVRVEGGSNMLIVGGALIRNNVVTGLLADGAGVITVVSSDGMPSPNPSEILGNGTDVSLNFGTRATFGAPVGSIDCGDGTSLARGSVTCP